MNRWKDNQQLVVSTELLYLLEWLITYEQETLKKMVSKALNEGLHKTLKADTQALQNSPSPEHLQQNIIDFLVCLNHY